MGYGGCGDVIVEGTRTWPVEELPFLPCIAKAGLRLRAALSLRKLLPDLPSGYLQVSF